MRTVLALLVAAGVASAQTIELASPAVGVAPETTRRVRVAGTATEALAAWIAFDALHAVRVDALGRAIDARSLAIASHDVSAAEVATDGRDYLIVYSTCAWEGSDCAMRFATVSPDGTVLHSRQRVDGAHVESLVWTGERYVLAYHVGSRLPRPATLAILDRRGFVLEDGIQPVPESIYYVDLAADPAGGIALVWAGPFGSAFAAGSLDEARRGTLAPIRIRNLYYPLTVAASSDGFIVSGDALDRTWRTVLLSRSGSVTANTVSSDKYRQYTVGATSTTRFSIFSETLAEARNALRMHAFDRATPASSVLPGVTTWWGFGVDVASTTDGGAVVGWDHQIREGVTEVHVRRVTPGGTLVLPPAEQIEPVNRGFVVYDDPVVRRCGDTFVAAWVERSDRRSIRYRRIASSGAVLDPPSRRATSLTPNDQDGPGIACAGDAILITWIETATRMTATPARVARGLLLADAGERLIELGPAEDVYATGIGGELIVVRQALSDFDPDWHEASHWRADGTQRTEWMRLFHQPSCHSICGTIESHGAEMLIVNANNCPGQGRQFVIARPFSRELLSLRAPVVFETGFVGVRPAIAAGPDGWLVAWGNSGMTFGRIARDFLGLDPRSGMPVGNHGPPDAAWNGSAFEIAGRDAVAIVATDGTYTLIPAAPAVRRVGSSGSGRRMIVTTERGEDGSMRVVGRVQ